MSKRLFDLGAALFALVATAPLFLVIAVGIRSTDRGPVFYRQERVGRGGRSFQIWKFRSMRVDADRCGLSITKRGDPRITPLGRILRRTKLDELPQLLNVMAGDMSFVGPRPEVPKYVALYTPAQREVLKFKPGITDLASLEFRDEEAMLAAIPDPDTFYRAYCIPRKITLNLEYAARASVWTDIRLIGTTIITLFTERVLELRRTSSAGDPKRSER